MTSGAPSREQLIARATSGDPQAQFDCAAALLDGDQTPADGARAIEFIEAAFAQGHAEATAVSALFEAMGAARPQSWPGAFDKLQLAAERGSAHARQQLLVLSGRSGASAERADCDWAELRSQIDTDALFQAPKRELLCDMPRIAVYRGFASPAECDWAMARARGRLQPAAVFHTASADQTLNPARDNSAIAFRLAELDVVMEVLRARISAATRLPVPIFEPVQVLHYAVGQQFRLHHDFFAPDEPAFAEQIRRFGQRIATVLVYLNDDYEGGETLFPKLGISHRGRAGDALFFTNVDRSGQGDLRTLHAGAPPTAGEKWVISQWIRDRVPGSQEPGGASAGSPR